jgi:hypothetical protein
VVVPVPAREKKRVFGRPSSVLPALPPLGLVLGDVPIPDPDGRHKAGQKRQKLDSEMESTVKRLIAHLKDEKCWTGDFSRQR